MGYIPHHLKITNNILYKIYRTNMISYANSANSDTREVGLQIANFQDSALRPCHQSSTMTATLLWPGTRMK